MARNSAQVLSDREYRDKNVWTIPFVAIILFAVAYLAHAWVNNRVNQDGFENLSLLNQYKWLNDHANYIEQLKEKINRLEFDVAQVTRENDLTDGKTLSAKEKLRALVEEYNEEVAAYEINSRKFKWVEFDNNIQNPPRSFEKIIP